MSSFSRSLLLFATALLVLALGLPRARADGAGIVVIVEGLRSNRGEVRGALYASADGWTDPLAALATCRARVVRRRATCILPSIAPGHYAFAFMHDENGNGALDRDLVGWPQEGFGFSNDAAPTLGPPSFASASFAHDGIATSLSMHARYGL